MTELFTQGQSKELIHRFELLFGSNVLIQMSLGWCKETIKSMTDPELKWEAGKLYHWDGVSENEFHGSHEGRVLVIGITPQHACPYEISDRGVMRRVSENSLSEVKPELKYKAGDGRKYQWDGTDGCGRNYRSPSIVAILGVDRGEPPYKLDNGYYVAESSLKPIVDEAPDADMVEELIEWITSKCNRCPLRDEKGNCVKFGCDIDCQQGVKNEIGYRIKHKEVAKPADKPDGFKVGGFVCLTVDEEREHLESVSHDNVYAAVDIAMSRDKTKDVYEIVEINNTGEG